MRKILIASLFFFLCSFTVHAQNTNVTGAVTDGGGQTWNNGTYSFNFFPSPTWNGVYKQNGVTFNPVPINGSLSATGTFTSVPVPDNGQITPFGTKWTITVCAQTNFVCFTSLPITITGASQTITSNINPAAILVTCGPGVNAYADSEVSCGVGGQYYNLTSSSSRQCAAVTGNVCTTWQSAAGSISTVSVLPPTCTPGTTAPVSLTVNGISYGVFYCGGQSGTANVWVPEDQEQTISPLAYGARADTQVCFGVDVSWSTNGVTNTITTSANCPFKPSDTGKIAFGTNGNGGALSSFAGTVALAQATLTYVSATTATTPGNATPCGPASTTCMFVWGTDDTTALTNAWAAVIALRNCGTLLLPQGMMLDQQPQFQTHDLEGCSPGGTGAMGNIYGASYTVRGKGIASSMIIPTPNFNFAGAVASGLFGGPRLQFFDWSIFGAANGATGAPSQLSIVTSGIGEMYFSKFSIVAWGGGDANLTGITCANTCVADSIKLMSAGSRSWSGGGAITNSTFAYSKTQAFLVTGTLNSVNNQIGFNNAGTIAVTVSTPGVFNSAHDNIVGGFVSGNNVGVQATAGGTANLAEDTIVASGASTGRGVWANGGKIFARGTSITGGSGGGSAILQDTNGLFTDLGGNSYVNAFSFTTGQNGFVPFKSVAGACTGTVTASLTTGGIYGTGPNISATACNAAPNNAAPGTLGLGLPMDHAGTLGVLQVSASAAGTNASSGLVTVMKNGVATTIICTVGTATSCVDNTHTVAFAYGDLITFQYTTQAADTLAGLKINVGILN